MSDHKQKLHPVTGLVKGKAAKSGHAPFQDVGLFSAMHSAQSPLSPALLTL